MIYLVITLLIFGCSLIPKISTEKKFFVIVLILSMLTMFRLGVGADYYSYSYIYDTVDGSSLFNNFIMHSRIEKVFLMIMYFFKYLGVPSHYFIAAISLIILWIFSLWIIKNSNAPVTSIMIFYSFFLLVWSWSALRQGLVLAIGTYLFFSKNNNIKIKNASIIILVLSLIHISALIYFPLIFVDKLNVSKKKIFIMLLVSILVSFIPFVEVLKHININYINRIVENFDSNFSVFSPSYMFRVLLAFFGLYILFRRNNTLYINRISKAFIVGYSFYFIFSRFPIVGTRINIYTYVLIIILLPLILEDPLIIKSTGRLLFSSSLILSICIVSITKEVTTMKVQSFYTGSEKLMPYTSIFRNKSLDFNSKFSILINRREVEKEWFDNFTSNKDFTLRKSVDSNDTFILANHPIQNSVFLINQFGDILKEIDTPGDLLIYNDVLVSNWQLPLFKEMRYFDLTDNSRSRDELMLDVYNEIRLDIAYASSSNETITNYSLENISKDARDLIANVDLLNDFVVHKISTPFEYYIAEVKYEFRTYYLYLDDELDVLVQFLLPLKSKYDRYGIMYNKLESRDITINEKGDIIWIE